jgi:hypothetical protein
MNNFRIPTIQELQAKVDYTLLHSPATKDDELIYSYYWSSTTYACSTSYVWGVDVNHGYTYYVDKLSNSYVSCVRTLEDGTLEWTKTADKQMTWQEAMDYAEAMNKPKPKTEKQWLWRYKEEGDEKFTITTYFYSKKEAKPDWTKLPYTEIEV